MRNHFVESLVERRELALDRSVQVPVYIQVDELLLVLVGDADAGASSLEFDDLLHAKVVIASAECQVHRIDVLCFLDVSQSSVEVRLKFFQILV